MSIPHLHSLQGPEYDLLFPCLRDNIVFSMDFQKVKLDFIILSQSLILKISESVHSQLVRCSKQAADAVYREV